VADPNGVLLVDKPAAITSHDVVSRVRRWAGTRRVGHAGTLDPMATGVLVVGLGRSTRLLTYLVGLGKTYTATIRLGQATETDDAEGEVVAEADATGLTSSEICSAVGTLTGEIDQVPSSVSAVKIAGRRAYARVRDGEQVQLAPRRVRVHRFELTAERRLDTVVALDVVAEVSSGTYVRALARDLGAALGVGGHLTALRRTRVGPYRIEDAVPLDTLPALDDSVLLSPAQAACAVLPVRHLDDREATALGYGKRLSSAGFGAGPVAAVDADGHLVAIVQEAGPTARPVLVLAPRG
jgi:tRNA pseudouridine55 synthase